MTRKLPSRDEVIDALEELAQNGVAGPGTAALFDVGTTEFLKYFEREVFDELVANGGSTCKIFEGAYGSGKSHLLQLLQESALQRGMAVVRTDLSQALNLEDWHLITKHVLQNIEWRSNFGTVRSLPRVLDAVRREPWAKTEAVKSSAMAHPGFARAISLACNPDTLLYDGRVLLGQFLQGERVSAAALKACGVLNVKHPLSKRNAELVLKTILSTLRAIGVPGTLLLFDETEKTFAFNRANPPRKVVVGANLLRRLIDASANGSLVSAVIVFAVLQDFVDNCGFAYAALGQRLRRAPTGTPVAWRWPVLALDAVNSAPEPKDFVKALAARHESVLQGCGVHANGARREFVEAGMMTISRHAGSEYKRYVVKKIASMALDHLS